MWAQYSGAQAVMKLRPDFIAGPLYMYQDQMYLWYDDK